MKKPRAEEVPRHDINGETLMLWTGFAKCVLLAWLIWVLSPLPGYNVPAAIVISVAAIVPALCVLAFAIGTDFGVYWEQEYEITIPIMTKDITKEELAEMGHS